MNRVVLLGNGFDLAHGMKTGYIDFIKWYIAQRIMAAQEGNAIDALLKVTLRAAYRGVRPRGEAEIMHHVHQCYEDGFNLNSMGPVALDWDGRTYKSPYVFEPQARIFKALIKQCSIKRWVDVEAVFYETLIEVLEAKMTTSQKEAELKLINESMAGFSCLRLG